MNKHDYINKDEETLNNSSGFKIINSEWFKHIASLEDKL